MWTTAKRRLAARILRRGLLVAGGLSLLLAWSAPAQAVELSVGSNSGFVGEVVTVLVTVDDLTGLGAVSYELRITWSTTRAIALSALETGTLTAPWGSVTFNTGPGWLEIAAAGATPLSGAGTLIELEFQLGPSTGSTTLTLADALFNEGTPAVTAQNNGSLSISALPIVNVSPDTGEIAVGESLAFSSSGGTVPYTYTSSDPGVANFAGNLLFGLSPGAVSVDSEGALGVTGTTTGVIEVRALRLEMGAAAGSPGQFVWVTATITDPVPYDITSFSFGVSYNATRMTAVSVDVVGTLVEAASWSTPAFHLTSGRIDIAASGSTPLPGSGPLIDIVFRIADAAPTSSNTLTPIDGIFREVYPPRHVNGSLSITAPPTITVSPDLPKLVVDDLQQFTVSGSTTPPLIWGVTDPAVGSIDASGLFTALASGETRVFVVDAVGATDTTRNFQVCDFYLYAPSGTLFGVPTALSLQPDRSVTGLEIYGYEFLLNWDSNYMDLLSVDVVGTSSQPWGVPVQNLSSGQAILVNAGSLPLVGSDPILDLIYDPLPLLQGSSRSITITKMLFNEGTPCALVIPGSVTATSTPEIPLRRAELQQNIPNPFNPSTRIQYTMDAVGKARLSVFDVSGAHVVDLVEGWHPQPGEYSVLWNGRDATGRAVPSGVYFYRFVTEGVDLKRKMVLLK